MASQQGQGWQQARSVPPPHCGTCNNPLVILKHPVLNRRASPLYSAAARPRKQFRSTRPAAGDAHGRQGAPQPPQHITHMHARMHTHIHSVSAARGSDRLHNVRVTPVSDGVQPKQRTSLWLYTRARRCSRQNPVPSYGRVFPACHRCHGDTPHRVHSSIHPSRRLHGGATTLQLSRTRTQPSADTDTPTMSSRCCHHQV